MCEVFTGAGPDTTQALCTDNQKEQGSDLHGTLGPTLGLIFTSSPDPLGDFLCTPYVPGAVCSLRLEHEQKWKKKRSKSEMITMSKRGYGWDVIQESQWGKTA